MIDAEDYATRAFPEAQRLLVRPTIQVINRFVDVGWFDSDLSDRAHGSFAFVRTGAGWDEYIGDVIRVIYGDRSCFAHVWGERDIIEEVAVSRRAFLSLALLTEEAVPCLIEKEI